MRFAVVPAQAASWGLECGDTGKVGVYRVQCLEMLSSRMCRVFAISCSRVGNKRARCDRHLASGGLHARASIVRNPIRSALEERTQAEPFEGRSRGMAREMSNRGGRLTPEQAREGHRWIRLTVLAAVLQVWMMATVVALLAPHLLPLSLALGVVYSLAAPLLFRYLNRDVERRVITAAAADGLARLANGAPLN